MTETESENRKRLKYEIGAKVKPDGSFQPGYSHWPNGVLALSIWNEHAYIYNSKCDRIACLKFKSWKQIKTIQIK